MLRIWLFGSMSVGFGETDRDAIAIGGRCASLLAYLALGRGRLFSRAELLSNVWSERDRPTSAGSFNTALWRLRRQIERPPLEHGDLIVCDRRGAIGLKGRAGVWLDVEEFTRAITPGLTKPPEKLGDEDIEGLHRGLELYKSDILLDINDDWALREREKLRRDYLNVLWRLMQLASIRREYAEGIRHAQAILDSDALREDVHRELMQLFVLNGQRAHALRQFEHCRDLLRRELAIHPMRETMALYQRIVNSAITVESPPPAERAQAGEATRPMDLIALARGHLAAADSQLQLTLHLMDR